ncbi:MAG: hypothetical protein LC802_06620 [Acidobacteria bacterium]|nr:hypothetical protein [Acidobacteriota bacterium]
MKKLQTGFTFDPHAGATYSFEHMRLAEAEERARATEAPHIVEAINWTTSEGGAVHYNRYFAHDFDEAIGLAVRLRIGFEEGVEEVVAIRPATAAEASAGSKASAHFLELMPLAVSSIDRPEGVAEEGALEARAAGRGGAEVEKKARRSRGGARGTAARAIDRGADTAGDLGDRAADLANSAVEVTAGAVKRVSSAAGEVLKRVGEPIKRATKAAPGRGRAGRDKQGRLRRKASKKGGKK